MEQASKEKKRYYRKNVDFFNLLEKIKLWPSRGGTLHGIKSMTKRGSTAEIVTHCNRYFTIYNSKHSRAARWMRNKLHFGICPTCRIPEWKLQKYSSTVMSQHYGARL
jgi:pyrrolysyl-tRNA synthetase, N-terminal region